MKFKPPNQFGGVTRSFRHYWHDGIQYTNSARFDSDEQIDTWLEANTDLIVKSARTITSDGYLTVYWN